LPESMWAEMPMLRSLDRSMDENTFGGGGRKWGENGAGTTEK